MLSIYINSEEKIIRGADDDFFSIYPIEIVSEGKFVHLHDCDDMGKIDQVEMFLRFPKRCWRYNLNPNVQVAIINYLNCHHSQADENFNCYSFVNMIFGLKQHQLPEADKFWISRPRKSFSSAGDVIFLVNDENGNDVRFRHAAFCIGFGLYVSVYGNGGCLEVSRLKSMKNDFKANLVLKATPR